MALNSSQSWQTGAYSLHQFVGIYLKGKTRTRVELIFPATFELTLSSVAFNTLFTRKLFVLSRSRWGMSKNVDLSPRGRVSRHQHHAVPFLATPGFSQQDYNRWRWWSGNYFQINRYWRAFLRAMIKRILQIYESVIELYSSADALTSWNLHVLHVVRLPSELPLTRWRSYH